MWLRLLILFLLFGFLGISQTSFLAHFDIMGATLNIVFILFFLVVFFEDSQKYIQGIFSAITAGFFLDIISSSYFGGAIVLLLIITFIMKHLLSLLKKTKDKHPVVYFVPLFILSLFIFNLPLIISHLGWVFLIEIFYNLVFALFGFYLFKTLKLYEFEK